MTVLCLDRKSFLSLEVKIWNIEVTIKVNPHSALHLFELVIYVKDISDPARKILSENLFCVKNA